MDLVKRVDKKTVIAVISIMIALFFGINQMSEDKPNISLVVLNSTNVLDVHEPVKDLSISFQGEDIQKEELNLRIITLKMMNDGEIDILQNHYNMNDTWGIRVTDGEIIEVRLVESNSEYIKSDLNPRLIKDEGLIELEKIIFDRGKYFVLEILVLHEKLTIPTVLPMGKIAGIEEIGVSEVASESEEVTFFKEAFSGSAGVQFVRTVSYFFVFIGLIGLALLISFGVLGINNTRRKISRKNEFKRFLKGIEKEARIRYSRQLEILSNIYVIRGKESLKTAKYLIEDGTRIREWLERRKPLEGISPLEELKRQKDINAMEKATRILAIDEELEQRDIAIELVDKKIASEGENKELVVDEDFARLLDGIVKDLEA